MNPVSARLPVSSTSRSAPICALDLGALGRRPLVVPEDRGADHTVAAVERDQAVHLPREPDARDLAALGDLAERRLCRIPPVLGVLLRPPRLRRRERVAVRRGGEHLALRRERDRLDARRPDVEAHDGGHGAQAPRAA